MKLHAQAHNTLNYRLPSLLSRGVRTRGVFRESEIAPSAESRTEDHLSSRLET